MTFELFIPLMFGLSGSIAYLTADGTELSSVPLVLDVQSKIKNRRDKTRVRFRLAQVGREGQYENFRVKQLMFASLIGAGAFLVSAIILNSAFPSTIISGISFLIAFFYVDRSLTRDVMHRKSAIENEFPSIIEMLTLSLSAGQTPLGSMNRIAERATGFLASEFALVVSDVRKGSSFHLALDAMGVRIDSVQIRRFVDALITAMLRGAPLIEVLQRHALEARSNQRNALLSKAGKAEISMMIPVVFLILPISVMFALWPSLTNLNLFAA